MKKPLVSILIPCYNAEKYIAQAIQSALDQTYKNKEVIVIDDGSTDNSLKIIKSFGKKIRWKTQKNKGGNYTRNRLLRLAKGEWLQYLDADDYLLPDKVKDQMACLSKKSPTDIVFSPVIIKEMVGEETTEYVLEIPEGSDIITEFIKWGALQTSGFLWKKDALGEVGAWKEGQKVCQEHELLLRCLKSSKKFLYFDKPNSVYRRFNETSVSKRSTITTVKERMKLTDELQKYLKDNGILNKEKQKFINNSRFICARKVYAEDPGFANELIEKVNKEDAKFMPSVEMIPLSYKIMYKILGFNNTEKIAKYLRKAK